MPIMSNLFGSPSSKPLQNPPDTKKETEIQNERPDHGTENSTSG